MVVYNNVLAGAAGSGGAAAYEIERSLRFNQPDGAYLNKSIGGSATTFTVSCWIKLEGLTSLQTIFGFGSATYSDSLFYSGSNNQFSLYNGSSTSHTYSTAVFRDFSAWYHLHVKVSSGSPTLYVNGVETITTSGYNWELNGTYCNIGAFNGAGTPQYSFSGYMADFHCVEGQALDPSSFAETDATTGVWNPKEYSGTYGTNGFHLNFSDNSSDAALGTDSSGNNNTWTVNNLSAGANIANKGFDVLTYTGTGSTQTVGGLKFQPGLVWIKSRTSTASHELYDSLRGATKRLFPSLQNGQSTITNGLTGFTSNGFTLGGHGGTSGSSTDYVAWAWKAGGAATTNNDGNISSQVSANTAYGFSIVQYTGNGSTSGSVGHGLGSTPQFVIVKRTDSAGQDWKVRHTSLGSTEMLSLNQDYGAGTASWNGETSSVFYPARSGDTYINGNTNEYIAYCWSEVPGFSKFGSWTGNGSSSGPLVTLGFKPRFVLFKRSDTSGDNWTIFDTARDSGTLNFGLQPNVDDAEQNFGNREILVNATGFRVTSTGSSSNENGATYIYAAFAEGSSSGIDSLLDSPSNYEADSGNNGGNYCVLNPLDQLAAVLSNGNLEAEVNEDGARFVRGTIAVSSGKWYWEYTVLSGTSMALGVVETTGTGNITNSQSYYYYRNGTLYGNTSGVNGSWGGSSLAVGDVLGVALDMDNGTLKFYKNGTLIGTAWTGLQGKTVAPAIGNGGGNNNKTACNFGQRQFSISSVPTGYKSLCTQNFDDPLIADGSDYFDVSLYTGNGTTGQSITGLEFSPDLVWIKERSSTGGHSLVDTIRGVTKPVMINTNTEYTKTEFFDSFDSNGFTVDYNGVDSSLVTNRSNQTYAAWAWDAGDAANPVSNTDGSVTSQVRVNQTAGFSIVSWTASNSSNGTYDTIGHGLNATPGLVITKRRNVSDSWYTAHGFDLTQFATLNSQGAFSNAGTAWGNGITSSVIGMRIGNFVGANDSMIAYCFAPVAGYSAFGSYEGNSSSVGPFIYTGFRPRWIMYKWADGSGEWAIRDTARSAYNVSDQVLSANSSGSEQDNAVWNVDILSNGFKIRTSSAGSNSSSTFVYAAFAESPLKYARAR